MSAPSAAHKCVKKLYKKNFKCNRTDLMPISVRYFHGLTRVPKMQYFQYFGLGLCHYDSVMGWYVVLGGDGLSFIKNLQSK